MAHSYRVTSGVDIVVAGFAALNALERDAAWKMIREVRLEELAAQDSAGARKLRSLVLVARHLGDQPLTVTAYRKAFSELAAEGMRVDNAHALIRFYGSWRQAREALELAQDETAKQVEARFARRRLAKVWRYTEQTLRQTLADCILDLERVPQLGEFEHWRSERLRLAAARGEDASHLPSAGPYRRRYGSWEQSLLALGYTSDQVKERLERP